jgi:hypothetical protein
MDEAVLDASIHAARVSIHAGCIQHHYMPYTCKKAMYSSLLGCFAVFEKRGEQYGCIHVLAVSRCIKIECIKIHPNFTACKVRMYWRDLDVLYLYRGCNTDVSDVLDVFILYLACIVLVF